MTVSNFALCLLAQNREVSEKQKVTVESSYLSKKYSIEYWERSLRNQNQYPGFSSMVNEAIDDTNSEFMVFWSGKTKATPEDIEDVITKLCSGYCFVATVSLGLFGATKELFRNIGMFDERFLGGELEDDDLALRLNIFNKAVYWMFDTGRYDFSKGNYPLIRGTSTGRYLRKWNENPTTQEVFLSAKNTEKQISRRHSERNLEIYNSWKDKSYSICWPVQKTPPAKVTEYKVGIVDYEEKAELCSCKFNIRVVSKRDAYLEFLTDNVNTFPVTIGIYCVNSNRRYPIAAAEVYPNTWRSFSFALESDQYEVRLYSDGDILYHNILKTDFEFTLDLNILRYTRPL